jgi:hypothetical protein
MKAISAWSAVNPYFSILKLIIITDALICDFVYDVSGLQNV